MRLNPWIMPFAFAAAMLAATSVATADEHEPLDDQALEEEYGIKEGAVKRDEEDRSSDTSESESNGDEEKETENDETSAGTGGTGEANADNEESEDGDSDTEDDE